MLVTEEQKRLEKERRDKILKEYLSSEEYRKSLILRAKLNDVGSKSLESRAYIWYLCNREDNTFEGAKFFIENFLYTFNPKMEPKHFPFFLYPFQDDAIRWFIDHVDNGKDGLIEKSREMGATWIFFAAMPLYYWLFRDGVNILVGSYKEMLVDDYTTDSIFGKIDYLMQGLPRWLLPKRFNPNKHRTKLKLRNPNGNLVSGDTMNPNFGRGARKTAVLFDELGFWDYAKDAWESCLSGDHDVLTDIGWKNIKDITIEDKVYSMDLENRQAEYMPVEKINDTFYKQMIHLKGKSIDSIVSEDHNMLIENRSGILEFRQLKDIVGKQVGNIPLVNNSFYSEKTKKPIKEYYGFDSGDWMEFLGWYISEGCHATNGGIYISQSLAVNEYKVKRIRELLDRMGVDFSYNDFDRFYIFKGSIPEEAHKELKGLGKCSEKYIPRKYLDNTKENLLRLWLSLLMGDGYNVSRKDRNTNVIGYITTSYRLAGQIQELLQKLGYNASVKRIKDREGCLPIWNIRLKHKKKINIDKLEYEYIDWNSNAYCLTTPYHTIFVRRNGLAYWVGNCGDSTSCRIANSTPHGYNYYAMLRESGMDVLTLHWKEHPLKDQEWYEFEKLRRTEEEVAQELDISYTKSREGKVYPEWNDVNVQTGLYEYQPDLPLYVGWDFGKTDDTAIIWVQINHQDEMIVVDTYRNNGKNIDYYIPLVTGIVPGEWDYKYTKEELELIDYHKNWKKATHFGDPSGRFRNQVTDLTIEKVLRNYGIHVNYKDNWKEFKIRKRCTKHQLMNGVYLNDNARTKYFEICIINSSYPKVKSEGVEQVRSEKPKHDAYCLAGDTKIRTLDGWHEIKDLVDKDFYVWSYSKDAKRLVPTKADKCWKSGISRSLIQVTLDTGKKIKCTLNHRFMLRNGDYKEAQDLHIGQSLMPYYESSTDGYKRVELNDGSHAIEHQYVFTTFGGTILNGFHIHHIDGNKTNNNPENLEQLSIQEHILETKPYLGNTFESYKKRNNTIKQKASLKKCPICDKEFWCTYKQIYCSKECNKLNEKQKKNIQKRSKDGIDKTCVWCGKEFVGFKRTKTCSSGCARERTGEYNKQYNENYSKGIKIKMSDIDKFKNHKIIDIKYLQEKQDVYDIEVPDYHNFVANGVVLHNSHYRSALEYLCVGLQDVGERTFKAYDKFPKKELSREAYKKNVTGY